MKNISAIIIAGVLILSACSKDKNPVEAHDHDEHTKAVGLVIKQGENEVVRAEKGQVTGALSVKERTESPVMQFFLIAEDGDLFQPADEAYLLVWESKAMEIADLIQYVSDGRWGFRVKGFRVGSTAVVFKVKHGDHDDFVSLDIPVIVTSGGGGL